MSSYSQRFLKFNHYFSDIIEDILAVTVCLPFTLSLYALNSLTDSLTELILLPERTDATIWKIGRFILTLPLYTLKGIASLTLTPSLSLICALFSEAPQYRFNLGRLFQIYSREPLVDIFVRVLLAVISPFLFNNLLLWGGLILHTLSSGQLSIIGHVLIQLDYQLRSLLPILPYAASFSYLFFTLSPLASVGLALILSFAWLEGQYRFANQSLATQLDRIISSLQQGLLALNMVTFKNKIDHISLDNIQEIPRENLFVSDDNYAFDISQLAQYANRHGLKNYNIQNPYPHSTRFTPEEITRLETHPKLSDFPQLAKFIRDHKHEYYPNTIISAKSLELLKELANKMKLSQHRNPTHFAEKFVVAKENFESHLKTTSSQERALIENVNLLGGNDEEYQLKNVLSRVYNGSWCKKGAAQLLHEAIQQIELNGDRGTPAVFWQRINPTHWLILHRWFN